MLQFWKPVPLAGTVLISVALAQIDPQLTGTWSTKSQKVLTGPGFYDPVNDKMIEPDLTGISYSFTDDGHYEEAYYRAISNPSQPQCPQAIMQFQHGTFLKSPNGSLTLTPISVDGRQLLSNPCSYDDSVYTRYAQSELIEKYEVLTDSYHNILRLNLFQFDGSPMNPMYLAYKPPQMLPTQTLNPTTATSTGGAKSTGKVKAKRNPHDLGSFGGSIDEDMFFRNKDTINANWWWWIGVGMTAIGGMAYFCF
ncbi:Reversal of tor2 lethality [Schaereria dolodes]|nr:Reversal of tor2 lethality [Schaereria dolodes]